MRFRLLIGMLLLATVWQGQMLAFAGAPAPENASPTSHCQGNTHSGNECDACCSQISMTSCAAQCAVSLGMAAPPVQTAMQRLTIRGILIPEVGMARLAHHIPPQLLRPPIVAALTP